MDYRSLFDEIDQTLGFRWITPINFNQENAKLEEAIKHGHVYHPVYQYPDRSHIEFDRLEEELNHLEFDTSKIGRLYELVRLQKQKELTMYRFIGDAVEFSAACSQLYGRPDPSLKETCLTILNQESIPEELIYSAQDLKARFVEVLHSYNLDDWEVLITNQMGSKVMVGYQQIWINSNHRYSENDRKRLCAHEISTHVLRAVNGTRREDPIYLNGTCGSMDIEEGLAIYNEELSGVLNLQMLKTYAARYLCTLAMEHCSLYELVCLIQDYVGLKQAIYIASRIKAGLCNTAEPGGFSKDQIYFKGYNMVKASIENDPAIYQKLYYGRISLTDISLLDTEIQTAITQEKILLPFASM